MLSTVKDDKYLILEDDCVYADEYDKEKLDSILANLKKGYSLLADVHSELGEFFPEIECLVRCHGIDICEELKYADDEQTLFTEALKGISCFQEYLDTHDDAFPPPEERMTLEDLGFHYLFPFRWYEKTVEESEERDVVEEIQIRDKVYYRRRTTEWETADYGRSSKSISYEDLPITEELEKIINNTQKRTKEI